MRQAVSRRWRFGSGAAALALVAATAGAQPPDLDRVDITAWRQPPAPTLDALSLIQRQQPSHGARAGMKLAPRRSFAAELKAIGMQLDNGARITLRRKNGKPALHYRQQF